LLDKWRIRHYVDSIKERRKEMKNAIINELKKSGKYSEKGCYAALPEMIERGISNFRTFGKEYFESNTTLGPMMKEIVYKLG
jgi:hypothetical protein